MERGLELTFYSKERMMKMATKKHPWKFCPAGSYYVKAHYKTINGKEHYWSAHCRDCKGKKYVLNTDEMDLIAERFKKEKLTMPKSYNFGTLSGRGNKYDYLIAGWVKYWSDIFGKNNKISVHFVKILIMSESSFNLQASATTHNILGKAMGLMQITDYTLKLIQENNKELRNHAFNLKRDDLFDPNVNICVGVRWLYRKREITKYFLKKEPSEMELAEEYKGIRNDKSFKAKKQRERFKELYAKYKTVKNKQ